MKKKLLVVENTLNILLLLKEYLSMEGYEILTAQNGREALALNQNNIPDLIITDLVMDEMDGFELIKRIRNTEALKKIPIIVFSARPLDDGTEPSDIGADHFVLKPSSPEVLLRHIKKLLDEA